MVAVIDPKFSVYELVERVEKQSTLLRHRRTMSLISYEIENATLMDGAKTRVFSSFQVMSKFLPQEKRYRKLARQAESVYVFGVPDITPPKIDGITYIYLNKTDALAKEWFLVSYGPDYASALATHELSKLEDPDHERVFKGLWTFDERIVSILEEWLTSAVDAPPLIIPERNDSSQIRIMSGNIARLTSRLEHAHETNVTKEEVSQTVEKELQPALNGQA